jgi:hypothetical protein
MAKRNAITRWIAIFGKGTTLTYPDTLVTPENNPLFVFQILTTMFRVFSILATVLIARIVSATPERLLKGKAHVGKRCTATIRSASSVTASPVREMSLNAFLLEI